MNVVAFEKLHLDKITKFPPKPQHPHPRSCLIVTEFSQL